MRLCDLPDDVLRLVFRQLLAGRPGLYGFKGALPLAWTCRRWRCIALPMVHSTAHVQCSGAAAAGTLGLAAAAGCAQMVRAVTVDVGPSADPLPALGAAAELMAELAAGAWRGVRSLKISVRPRPTAPAARSPGIYDDDGDDGSEAQRITDALAAAMPGVRRLEFGQALAGAAGRAVGGRLAACYAEQLQRLRSAGPLAVPDGAAFAQLCDVRLCHDAGCGPQLPRMAPAALTRLVLTTRMPGHLWAAFDVDGSGAVRFECLRVLDLTCLSCYSRPDPAPRRDECARRLHFPALERMTVRCTEDACPVLRHAVLPPRMDAIFVELTADALHSAAGVALPPARSLALTVKCGSEPRPAAMLAAVRMLEGARESGSVDLIVADPTIPVAPEVAACASLTRLAVEAATGADAVLGLIHSLPRLVSLGFWRVSLAGTRADISLPDPQRPVVPFAAKIKTLSINIHHTEERRDLLVPLLMHLLLRSPALARLVAIHAPRKPVVDLVAAHGVDLVRARKMAYLMILRTVSQGMKPLVLQHMNQPELA
ncbi:hypothetical protein H4R18_000178 [Coemansia javaensis]|uniref:F-box domain-containing protein n=1 Tax=Coemansia javaensis TaxID=2761396 RepID=A0A9W8HQ96_9FUNG|nr:hypothetical protein H4R18_000178 [Coemansia javaensis]